MAGVISPRSLSTGGFQGIDFLRPTVPDAGRVSRRAIALLRVGLYDQIRFEKNMMAIQTMILSSNLPNL
jgi:hypothetical protein